MSRFIQLHLLTSYPPSNLNRDDLNRPKTAILGGANRLRISSQSLKRAWRTSDVFQEKLSDYIGIRTKEMGLEIFNKLIAGGIKEKDAKDYAKAIANVFGKLKGEKKDSPNNDLEIEQLAHFSPEELKEINELTGKLIKEKRKPNAEELELLKKENTGVDIAMFGRMLASSPAYNKEAAVQVAHAITVHKVAVEDDFFTAVDDLNKNDVDAGAGHLGDTEFGAGLFYLYICIDREQLQKNLSDKSIAKKALAALLETCTTVAPTGKQNSFASRARAMYCLAEKGRQQPRSLHAAFLQPIEGTNLMEKSIQELCKIKENFNKVYGKCSDSELSFNVLTGEGNLETISKFIQED
ncbi:type I-E CRISPR-associated protein Cas7/Cse4/CasC [Leptospira noguchii]|uniref:type I-E CRISPR-associated protein Cas7/Cse4/CasC n=1 Tax=Leptospira noguchii TaxID=28182 RepID=UPI000774DA17|nr:type I-E CRISPR-associated protein Cas7/Cse4/CasC [Leptospira noguchii]UOG33510.1 type I-E CRISPR-associated protein Cas7/Cse4/CasC [Leptospira noguchii]UOG44347.1 type I-E CRISPR-associated protein Cas7/Cse4/CasC [Leptospira noguchii]UOG59768.1 type I-E CRISPR-associated protein Cas7/Cse4/CasC [Leptospira noguchii]